MKAFRKFFLAAISLFSTFSCYTQVNDDDQVNFQSAVDWLNAKLDYVYYNDASQKWWTNTFYINDDKEVTIKQISSKTRLTTNLKEKKYIIRTFKLSDINPYDITVKKIQEASGRFSEGSLVELRTFSGNPSIAKTINKRKATSTSFLHLPFPKFLTDSINNYPELVKDKFYEAITAATKLYAKDVIDLPLLAVEVLEGTYKSESGAIWKATRLVDGVIEIASQNAAKYFGYDQQKKKYYLLEISSDGLAIKYYSLSDQFKLLLMNSTDPKDQLLIETRNSFKLGNEWYYRS